MPNTRQDNAPFWLISGLPRSGQQQLANRLSRAAKPPVEVILDNRNGCPEWPIDAASAKRTQKKLKRLARDNTSVHSILYMRAPLLAAPALSEIGSYYHIHVVRDPRQLFVAYARQPQVPNLLQLARACMTGRRQPLLRPLWDNKFPGIELLKAADDDTLRRRFADAGVWRLYGICYYIWALALLRNLRNGALCVEVRALSISTAGRADLVAFFAAFGLDVSFRASRMDRYVALDIDGDAGLPRAVWGSRLERRLIDRNSRFAAAETRVNRLLENSASQLDLWIEEDVAAALTGFIDPAYSLIILPFVRPWFGKSMPTQKPLVTDGAKRIGLRGAYAMQSTK